MKINDMLRLAGIQNYRKDTPYKSGGTDGKKPKQADAVQISPEALRLQNAQEAERLQRVQELERQVSAGTYHVDSAKIAEKLLPYLQD
ncbi:MAG TPA: flagellar biosynthesis anti-sigma factor FlgM [Bacilli bacterium]